MSRTRRVVVIPEKSHHRNAKPYKRQSHILFQKDFGDVEVTIERDNRRKAQY